MQCEILMVGSELLLGQILDTNAQFMGQTLAENGINLYQKTTVGDNPERIKRAMADALSRSDVVLVSGGLGPTEDDITRDCAAELLGRPLEFRQELFDTLAARFARFKAPITENNRKQAMAPRGATSIENPNGTAPGLLIEDERGAIICMPGVPWELKPMLTDWVVPYLRRRFDITAVIHSRVLKVCGLGESRVDDAIGDLMRTQANPTIGVLAYPDAVRIRLTARAKSKEKADALIDAVDAQVRDRLPGLVLADSETPERLVDEGLVRKNWTIALGESGTGGMMAHRFTLQDVAAFTGSLVRPAPAAGADLQQVARALADEVKASFQSGCVLAVVADAVRETAVAVFISPDGESVWDFSFLTGDERARIRLTSSAFERLRRHLMKM